MVQVYNTPISREFTNAGSAGAGYKLFFYITGTTTKKTVYADEALTTPLTIPVIADANGRFVQIFMDGTGEDYKVVLGTDTETDPPTSPIWTADPVDSFSFDANSFDPRPMQHWGTTAGTAGAYTITAPDGLSAYSDDLLFSVQAHITNTAAPTINVSGISAISLKKYDNAGAKVALEAGDWQGGQTYAIRVDSADAVCLNPSKPYLDLRNSSTATTALRGVSYLENPITIANGTDANNDIDFTAGNFDFDDGSGQAVLSAITKQLDAAWAVGTDAGGLDTGSEANSTIYYTFAIYNPTTGVSDALFSASRSSPTMPSGYTKKSYRGAIYNDGSGNIESFTQMGRWFEYNGRVLSLSDTTPANTKTDVPLQIPLVNCNVRFSVLGRDGSAAYINFFGENGVDAAPSQDDCDVAVESSNQAVDSLQRLTSDGNISYRSSNTAMDAFKIWTRAWEDLDLKY
jgi:hypothetical protein